MIRVTVSFSIYNSSAIDLLGVVAISNKHCCFPVSRMVRTEGEGGKRYGCFYIKEGPSGYQVCSPPPPPPFLPPHIFHPESKNR